MSTMNDRPAGMLNLKNHLQHHLVTIAPHKTGPTAWASILNAPTRSLYVGCSFRGTVRAKVLSMC